MSRARRFSQTDSRLPWDRTPKYRYVQQSEIDEQLTAMVIEVIEQETANQRCSRLVMRTAEGPFPWRPRIRGTPRLTALRA